MIWRIFRSGVVLLVALAISACDNNDKPKEEPPSDIYFYAGIEQKSLPFDETTGARKPDRELKDLSKGTFKLGHFANGKLEVGMSSFPYDEKMIFVVDGYHALSMSGEHVMASAEIADAFLEISGKLRSRGTTVGMNLWRGFILPQKELVEDQRASVLVKGSMVTGSLDLVRSSHLTIEPAGRVLVSNKWQTSTAAKSGLTIDASRRSGEKSDLWRLWNPSLSIVASHIKASSIHMLRDSSLSLRNARVEAAEFEAEGAVVFVGDKTKIEGNLTLSDDSYLFFDESSEYRKKPNSSEYEPVRMRISALEIEGAAKIDAKISIHVLWMPGDEKESQRHYGEFFRKQQEFVLVKAQRLAGHASLISQDEAQNDLGHYQRDVNYVERFAHAHGKKFALQHDYNKATITLKIVSDDQQVDSGGRLPDIGAP